MKATKTLLCVLFLVASAAFALKTTEKNAEKLTPANTESEQLSSLELKQLENLRSTSWGRSLFALAELQVGSSGVLTKLFNGLEKLEQEIKQGVSKENESYDKKRSIHDSLLQSIETKINDAKSEIARIKRKMRVTLRPRQKIANEKIGDLNKFLSRKAKEITRAQKGRADDKESTKRKILTLNKAIKLVDKSLKMMQGIIKTKPALIEYKKAGVHLKRLHAKLSESHILELPMIVALVELTASKQFSTKESAQQVLTLLNSLRGKLTQSLEKVKQDNIDAKKAYKQRMKTLNNEVKQAKEDIRANTNIVADTGKEIRVSLAKIMTRSADLKQLLKTKTKEIESWRIETETHKSLIIEMMKQIDGVQQVRNLFNSPNFKKYVGRQLPQDKKKTNKKL